jgi:hypothetical protein
MDSLKGFEGSTLKEADEVYKKEALLRETISKNKVDIEMMESANDDKLYQNIAESLDRERAKLQDMKSGKFD